MNWTLVQSAKDGKRYHSSSSEQNSPQTPVNKNKKFFFSANRYEVLSSNDHEPILPTTDSTNNNNKKPEASLNVKPKTALPPPIFLRLLHVTFTDLCTKLIEIIGVDNFHCKALADRLKIITTNPDSYRTLVRFLREEKAEFHTYQLREDKPTRVVIRNLHPTTPPELIKSELEQRLFEVRQVSAVLHKVNKNPLPLFFVDLEPTSQSNDIFQLTSLLHTKIKVEEPYKPKTISQCTNCQVYGHTKSYCGYPARCVRCGGHHSSSDCPNTRDAPPKCALCSGDHPSNYKGCTIYKDLQRRKNPKTSNHLSNKFSYKNTNVQDTHTVKASTTHPSESTPTYAQATSNSHSNHTVPSPAPDINKIIHKNQAQANYLANLSSKDGSLWQATKKSLRHQAPNTPLINPSGGLASTDADKAELLKNHLAKIFTPHSDIQIPHHTALVNRFLDSPLPPTLPSKSFTPNDIKNAIQNYSLKKSPGYDLITAEVAKCLPKRAIVLLTVLINASLRLAYFPQLWKFSIIIVFPKSKKPPDILSSYRPISLLPFFAKIFERLILKRILPYIFSNNIIPNTQFGFRASHATTHQLHRLVDAISFSLEKKKYCSCVFLDVSQAFDRVWHEGLLFKLKAFLPTTYFLLIKSYLTDRHFQVKFGSSFSNIEKISAGVPQGGILSPILYNVYAADQPTSPTTSVAEFADDKAIISVHEDSHIASLNLQNHLDLMSVWYNKWRVKVNQSKSIHTTFTLRLPPCPEVFLNNIPIPSSQSVKYLGLIFDRRLTWGPHIKAKKLALNERLRSVKSLISNKHTKLNTKLLIYKSLIKPMWTYGLQLWGNAKVTNVNKIQTVQNKILRLITKAPPYVSNYSLHTDLNIKTVHAEAIIYYKRFHNRLPHHPNPLISNLASRTIPGNPTRRLKRNWCRDLLNE
ncbi:hypothetical protein QTP88_029007 [Uroleucon formosanum]